MNNSLITIKNCRIENKKNSICVKNISWEMKTGEAWLVIGPNGGGKADFMNALSQNLSFIPNKPETSDQVPMYSSLFEDSTEIVSLERAASLIEEERNNDESEYIEGGVDIGRTGRIFIAESICGPIKKGQTPPDIVQKIETYPAVKLCGVESILDRGIKYMSTGEIRRTLLARALISGKKLLLLSDPFAGLDQQSRKILIEFFDTIVKNQLKKDFSSDYPRIILGMERYHEIPDSITNVIEFTNKEVSFCGTKSDYEKLIEKRKSSSEKSKHEEIAQFTSELESTFAETKVLHNESYSEEKEILCQMNNVNVGWGDHQVLRNFNWILRKNEHWIIQGPNGSGKTTFLELITGDNKQVYCNDIHIFGIKRGSGESIWDIKKELGIVSYRLHVEYRMLGGTPLQNVIISGFKDSIGLYETPTDVELAAAKKWLSLGGFAGRETEAFGNLSYGEQRAILILRSAVKCPKILILDEPCHGLDESYREKILNLMNLIGKQGTSTMLHVTHDPTEILECEKHVLELHPAEDPMYKIIIKE